MCDLPGQRLLSAKPVARFIVLSTVAAGRPMWTGPRSGGTAWWSCWAAAVWVRCGEPTTARPTGLSPLNCCPRSYLATTPQRQRRTGLIAAIAATVVVLASGIVGVTGHVLLRHRNQTHTATGQPAPPSSPAANTVQTAPPQPNSLNGLLLSVDQINTAMGTTGMSSVGTMTALPDNSFAVPDINGTLSATATPANSLGACERALTVANNVAVDVTACLGPTGAAISIAHQIAAKVR